MKDPITNQIETARHTTNPQLDQRILSDAYAAMNTTTHATTPHNPFVFRITRMAIAAAVLLAAALTAVMLFPESFSPQQALAQTIQNINASNAVTFNITLTQERGNLTGQVTALGSIVRTDFNINGQHAINITDQAQQTLLALDPASKQATLYTLGSANPNPANQVDIVEKLKNLTQDNARYLRRETLNNRTTHVYEIHEGDATGLVWIDAETLLPAQARFTADTMPQATYTDFNWNAQPDPTLLTLNIPDDYTLQRNSLLAAPQTNEFINALAIYAAFTDEPLPQTITDERSLGLIIGRAAYDRNLTPQQNHTKQLQRLTPITQRLALTDELLNDPKALQSRIDYLCMKADQFMSAHIERTGKWIGGATPGTGEQPLCWWKADTQEERYHLLLSNLTLRTVTVNELPE